MANNIITLPYIANKSLDLLRQKLVLGNLVYRDYASEFTGAKGDTLTIRKPATFEAKEFTTESEIQNITEGSVDVKLDTHLDVTMEVTDKQLALDIDNFTTQVIEPAVVAIVEGIESRIAGLYKDIPYFVEQTAEANLKNTADFSKARAILSKNKAPFDNRYLALDSGSFGKYGVLADVINAEKSGSTEALRNANMGRILGFDSFEAVAMPVHTAGAGTVKIDLAAGYSKGDTEIHVDGVTTALAVGDLLTIAGNQYVVKAAGDLETADQDITIYPALKANVANDVDVTVVATGAQSMAFHKNAFALVTRTLPIVGTQGVDSFVAEYEGFGIRVVKSYVPLNKKTIVSFDILCGFKTLTPELAVRLVNKEITA